MKQAVAYLRVSTESQATQGVSLPAQEEKIGAHMLNYIWLRCWRFGP